MHLDNIEKPMEKFAWEHYDKYGVIPTKAKYRENGLEYNLDYAIKKYGGIKDFHRHIYMPSRSEEAYTTYYLVSYKEPTELLCYGNFNYMLNFYPEIKNKYVKYILSHQFCNTCSVLAGKYMLFDELGYEIFLRCNSVRRQYRQIMYFEYNWDLYGKNKYTQHRKTPYYNGHIVDDLPRLDYWYSIFGKEKREWLQNLQNSQLKLKLESIASNSQRNTTYHYYKPAKDVTDQGLSSTLEAIHHRL